MRLIAWGLVLTCFSGCQFEALPRIEDAPALDANDVDAIADAAGVDTPVDVADVDAPVDAADVDARVDAPDAQIDATVDSCASGCLIYSEDFESYLPDTYVGNMNGWTSQYDVPAGRSPTLANSMTLHGRSPPNANTNGHVARITRPVSLAPGRIYTLAFDAYCDTGAGPSIPSAGTYVYFGTAAGTDNPPSNALAGWFCNQNDSAGVTEWNLDLRLLTQNGGDRYPVSGAAGFDHRVTMTLVINLINNEIRGRYDFGSGITGELGPYSVAANRLAMLSHLGAQLDYTSAATYLGGDIDNITLTVSP